MAMKAIADAMGLVVVGRRVVVEGRFYLMCGMTFNKILQ
jgi:hypothetical protein